MLKRLTPDQKVLRRADKAYKRRVRDAEGALKSARDGEKLRSITKATLYADRVVHGPTEVPLSTAMTVDVKTSGKLVRTKDRTTDTRKLFLIVENPAAAAGFTASLRPDDETKVREFAQATRLAAPGSSAAARRRAEATAAAERELGRVRGDRADIESAERALPAEAVTLVRRRARFAWLKWAGGVVAALLVLATIFGGSEDADRQSDGAGVERAATSPSGQATSATGATGPPPGTIEDANALVDEGDFPAAVTIAAALGGDAETRVGRRIANRIGRSATAAIRRGDRGAARRALLLAEDYPRTKAVRSARTQLRGAERRASARRAAAREQRAAARERRRQASAAAAERERQAEEEAAQQAEAEAPEPSESVGEGTCAEVGVQDFPVPPGDERDADGDGIACES